MTVHLWFLLPMINARDRVYTRSLHTSYRLREFGSSSDKKKKRVQGWGVWIVRGQAGKHSVAGISLAVGVGANGQEEGGTQ